MERRVNYLLIGGMFFVIIIAFVAFVLWFGHIGLGSDKMKKYYIYTQYDVLGIGNKTPVRYKGITIGNVENIKLNTQTGLVEIIVAIDKSIPINRGSSVVIDAQGLAGLNYLAFKPKLNAPLIGDDDEPILLLEKNFIGKITDQADQLANGMLDVPNNFHALMSKQNIENFSQTMASLNIFAKDLNIMSKKIDSILQTTNNLVSTIDTKVSQGEYDIKSTLLPTINQAEKSLHNLDSFLQKSQNLIDKFNNNPYNTLFGEQK